MRADDLVRVEGLLVIQVGATAEDVTISEQDSVDASHHAKELCQWNRVRILVRTVSSLSYFRMMRRNNSLH